MNDTFAIRLLRAMNAKGINTHQLCTLMGYTKSHYCYAWVYGKNMPDVKTVIKLCHLLDTDPNTLLGWNDEAR